MNKFFAINPDAEYRISHPETMELPEDERPVFIIRPLTAKDAATLEDNVAETSVGGGEGSTMRLKSGTSVLNALKKGLKGWENFKLSADKEVPWRDNNGAPHSDNFNYLPAHWRRWIAEKILEGKGLTEEESKNSD